MIKPYMFRKNLIGIILFHKTNYKISINYLCFIN